MQNLIGYFSPTLGQLAGLAALGAVCAGITIVGNAISARKRLSELDMVVGWSIVSLAFVAAGGVFDISFRGITWALILAVAVSAVVVYREPLIAGDLLRAAFLSLPFIWLAGAMLISQWDEFTHWMPNARYLVEHHTFPGAGKPPPSSNLPGYPHGLAYVIYLSSRIAGFLTENVSAAFNILLLASFAVLVGRVIRQGAQGQQDTGRVGWICCAIGCLAVTGLNPTFVPKIVFTAYADTPTAVLVGMMCIVMWYLLNALAEEETSVTPLSLAWSFGLIAMAAVAIKQPNIVLAGLIGIGGVCVAIRDPAIPTKRFLKFLPLLLLPAVSMYVFWRMHIEFNSVSGEFNFLPRADWLTDKIDVVVGKMTSVATKKGGYFSVMIVACIFAARALWRMRTPFDRLSVIIAVLFVGYTSFLLFVYVTAFGGNGLVAPSYWRFNMHLGGACVAFGAYAVARLWRFRVAPRMRRNHAWVVFALLIVVPFAISHKIRFDLHAPKVFVRTVAEEVVATLPKGVRYATFDATGNGEFEVIARYVISPHVDYVGFLVAAHRPDEKLVREFLVRERPQYVWVHVPTEAIEGAMSLKLAPRHSYLVERQDTGWAAVKSWPFPGYADPNAVPK